MRIYYPLISWSQFIRPHSYITYIASRLSFTIAIIITPFHSHQIVIPIQSIASFPSNELILIHHNDPSSIEFTLFRHLFHSYSPCNDPFWWITPHQNQSLNSWVKQSSSTLYFYHSSTHTIKSYPLEVAHVIAHWFITYLAMGKTHITPNYCYSTKQVLSHSIHLRIRFA